MSNKDLSMKAPNDRLTSKQVAEEFQLNHSTLRGWRRCRTFDKRYPRFHKFFTGKVFYIRHEITEDLAKMEVDTDDMKIWR